MGKLAPKPAGPAEPGWDIAFTRMSREVTQHVEAWVRELTLRFKTIGLTSDTQVRQTPRGLSTFLAVVGQRGLLLIVDITLIDGMAITRHPGVALDIRLLDACGDIVAHCASTPVTPVFHATSDQVIAAAGMPRSATSVYVMAMGHFDLMSVRARGTGM
jgi:hypothetical protein